ncbi:hypothetical protein LXL04_003274 [Taraxacum kok-saghyz]
MYGWVVHGGLENVLVLTKMYAIYVLNLCQVSIPVALATALASENTRWSSISLVLRNKVSYIPKFDLRVHLSFCESYLTFPEFYSLNPVYAVGHYIEVQKTIRECPNAYHVASILRMLEETVEVEYHNITTANGERYVEYVEYDIIRPTPYIFPTDFGFNDAIDVWMTDSWWPGLYVGTEANDYIVYLPYMPETNQNFLVPQEFTRRNCCRGCTNDISCWTYTKNN